MESEQSDYISVDLPTFGDVEQRSRRYLALVLAAVRGCRVKASGVRAGDRFALSISLRAEHPRKMTITAPTFKTCEVTKEKMR